MLHPTLLARSTAQCIDVSLAVDSGRMFMFCQIKTFRSKLLLSALGLRSTIIISTPQEQLLISQCFVHADCIHLHDYISLVHSCLCTELCSKHRRSAGKERRQGAPMHSLPACIPTQPWPIKGHATRVARTPTRPYNATQPCMAQCLNVNTLGNVRCLIVTWAQYEQGSRKTAHF